METLLSLAAALDAGSVTSRALVERCLAAIADPAGEGARAFITVYDDAARAQADALAAVARAALVRAEEADFEAMTLEREAALAIEDLRRAA